MSVIVWWEYVEDADYTEEDTGSHTIAIDHYESFATREDAEQALPQFLALDEDAYIMDMDD